MVFVTILCETFAAALDFTVAAKVTPIIVMYLLYVVDFVMLSLLVSCDFPAGCLVTEEVVACLVSTLVQF